MTLDERAVQTAEPGALPALIGELHRLAAVATARLVSVSVTSSTRDEPADDLMSRDDVAARLKIAPDRVHRVAALRAGRVRISHKVHRYRRTIVERIARKGAA